MKSLIPLFVASLLCFARCVAGETNFEPYEVNGGAICAVAGKDFCIIAADTRMKGSGYLLHSRNHIGSRLWSISDDDTMNRLESALRAAAGEIPTVIERGLSQAPIFVGSSGCTADCRGLQLDLRVDLRAASHLGQVDVSKPHQIATSLSQMLYQRRGFPYYAFCVAAALDRESRCGHVYVYDAIGSYEQVAVATSGTGREALQPILDRMFETRKETPTQVVGNLTSAIGKVCQAYRSVSEREIEVGDKLVLHLSEMEDDGMVKCSILVVPLKED